MTTSAAPGRLGRAGWMAVGFGSVGLGSLGIIVPGLPTTVFFDAQGRHAGAHMGLLNRAALDARVHALQAR